MVRMYWARSGTERAEQLLHRQTVADIIVHGRDVVEPVGEDEGLGIGAVFRQLFKAAMEIAYLGGAFDDRFAVQLKIDPEHTVGGRMLRSHTQAVVVALTIGNGNIKGLLDRRGHASSSSSGWIRPCACPSGSKPN
jgi:hypothetical protein